MTGRMTLPKDESWWMKKPKLVLFASSSAERWPEVSWPAALLGRLVTAGAASGGIPRVGGLPACTEHMLLVIKTANN